MFLSRHPQGDPSDPYFLGLCYFHLRTYIRARETFTAFVEKIKKLPKKERTERIVSLQREAESLIQTCDVQLAREAAEAKARAEKAKMPSVM